MEPSFFEVLISGVFEEKNHNLYVRRDMRRLKTWDFADQNETNVERLFKSIVGGCHCSQALAAGRHVHLHLFLNLFT